MSVVGRRRPSPLTSTGPRATRCQCSTKLSEPSFHVVLGLPRFLRGIQNEYNAVCLTVVCSFRHMTSTIPFGSLISYFGFYSDPLSCFTISLRASSPIWASEASLARTRERPSRLRRSPARSRETRFTRPNRRACSQAILRSRQVMFSTILS